MLVKLFTALPGGGSVELAAENEKPMQAQKDALLQLSFWQSLPTACPYEGCGSILAFFHQASQDGKYHYYGLRCAAYPSHETNFGERKDGATLYYKGAESFKLEYGARQERDAIQEEDDDPRQNESWGDNGRNGGNGGNQKPQNAAESLDQANEKRARALVAARLVRKEGDAYIVKQGTQEHHVTRENGGIKCSCGHAQPCEHRLAARYYTEQQNAPQQAETL